MLLAALIMGVAGSLHCAGMCSPLAMAVTNIKSPALKNRMLYNLGRITMYGILGAIVSAIGFVFPLSKFQNSLSIAFGVALIAIALSGTNSFRIPFLTSALTKFSGKIKHEFSALLRHKRPGSLVFLGALNGLLPCGLTYLALTFCITLTTPLDGFTYMFTFGVGTLPVMLGMVSVVSFISGKTNWDSRNITAGLLVLSGLLLIARVLLLHTTEAHGIHADIVICR